MKRRDRFGQEYNHIEAYCLMTYRCQDCGFEEVLWNSRDGVTPYGTNCPRCGSMEMLHVDWSKDKYAPSHIPEPGQGIWIDIPESLRGAAARVRIACFEGTEFELEPGTERWAQVFAGLVDDTFRPDSPWLVRWPGQKDGDDA